MEIWIWLQYNIWKWLALVRERAVLLHFACSFFFWERVRVIFRYMAWNGGSAQDGTRKCRKGFHRNNLNKERSEKWKRKRKCKEPKNPAVNACLLAWELTCPSYFVEFCGLFKCGFWGITHSFVFNSIFLLFLSLYLFLTLYTNWC